MKVAKIQFKRIRRKAKRNASYDSAWKDVIIELTEYFLEFFFPHIHKDIDFSIKPLVLNNELRSIKPYGNLGDRSADVLIKVFLKSGETACIFFHIEVQGNRILLKLLEERTYIYNYRIYDKYLEEGSKVISLVILSDDDDKYRPEEFLVKQWDFELCMKFPMVKLLDFKNKEEFKHKLETSSNPMAMVVKAQLRSHELKKAGDEKKSTVKYELIRECYSNKYPKSAISALLKFIDWLILLPAELDNRLTEKITRLEEDYKMAYVTSWERHGVQRGMIIGKEEGREEGARDRNLAIAREMLMRGYNVDVIGELTGLKVDEIQMMIN